MRLLLTNDDGINAPGLKVTERIAREISSDAWIVAPEQEQSGASHSLSLHNPVRVRKISARRYAVSGTPTDCALLAKNAIIPKKKPIDLVLSGVNRGSNVGDDITYSGTVSAAMEAALLGLPAIALSQLFYDGKPIYWETALKFAPGIIKKLLKSGWPTGVFINVNFPACTPDQVRGTVLAPMGKRVVSIALHLREDPRGRPYYWLGGDRDNAANGPDVDVAKLDKNYITVTPLKLDYTDYEVMKAFEKVF